MPLQATSGAASQDAFGGNGVAVVPTYIEDVFSTYLYTGNSAGGSTTTVTNNIDLSTKGGLVWIKQRDTGTFDTFGHVLTDSARGITKVLQSNNTSAQQTITDTIASFDTTGFTAGFSGYTNMLNDTYASWTFRKQPKFFDVVTYTGTGSNTTIAHALGSVPGCIIVKRTNTTENWRVYHQSLGNTQAITLNSDGSAGTGYWNNTTPTSTVFTVGTDNSVNASGSTYVAYIFAHDAGGFGLTGTDNVISCGSFTTNASTGNATINLGYEPQWILLKTSAVSDSWHLFDTMRGITVPLSSSGSYSQQNLSPNVSDAESTSTDPWSINQTGFTYTGGFGGRAFIYIAIRRGPMKVPTTGTSVFSPNAYAGTSSAQEQTTNFPVDLFIDTQTAAASNKFVIDRLRGSTPALVTDLNDLEDSLLNIGLDSNTGVKFLGGQINGSGSNYILWAFKRAPSVFDVVCYTGTGSATTFSHNLQAVPELIFIKRRDTTGAWDSYCSALANTEYVVLNTTAAKATGTTRWNSTTPTSSVFSVGTSTTTNASAGTYVAYLFSTCAGVSKVGSYTGTATTKQIDCGFTAGARFVLIKRTDSTGDWYVWDTARGIVSGNDSYLLLNSIAAEVTNTDYIDTYSAGFEISSTAPAAINANGGTYIFLAIA